MLMVIGLSISSQAQNATLMPLVPGDTVNATSALDTVTKTISVTAGYSVMGIQVNATKISGTVSLKAYIYGSLDGTNYIVSDSSGAFSDGSAVYQFTKSDPAFTSYKVQVRPATGAATTQSVKIRVYYVLRRHD